MARYWPRRPGWPRTASFLRSLNSDRFTLDEVEDAYRMVTDGAAQGKPAVDVRESAG
jgi:hypothetical protein